MKMKIICRLAALFILGLLLLNACASVATPTAPVQPSTSAPAAATKAAEATAPPAEATRAPAATRVPEATSAPSATRPPQATQAPTLEPAHPTPSAVPPAEVIIERRVVELEWPTRLRLGDSDVLRLALVPSEDGYIAQTEFPEHTLATQQVTVHRPSGYMLSGIARLDGVGFDISPAGDQSRLIPPGETVSWRWSLSPRAPGQQRLSVALI